ncbi:hypothetical protein WG219_01310 [Ectopseudomonas mendocina]|uniref:Lipoprotein n=1 Tax=Ectopseudomonas mendocina TaxID=300 RepID=A0ABZ2RLV1_ECTME
MRFLVLLLMTLTLAGCASTPLPPHDPAQAWVTMHSSGGSLLMADRLDNKRWPDGRYYQLMPGEHELQTRFIFDVYNGGFAGLTEPYQVTCFIKFRYADFKAGQRYRLEARPWMMKAQAWMYDEQRNVLVKGKIDRCGVF